MAVRAVAINTIAEAVRKKIVYVIFLVALALILSAPSLPSFHVGVRVTLFLNIALGLSSLTLTILSLALSVTQIPAEIEKKTIYNILSKPVSRTQFLLGKFIGVALTLLIISSLIGCLSLAFTYFYFNHWQPTILLGLLTIYFESLVLAAFAFFCSTFSTPTISTFLTILFYFIGHVKNTLLDLAERSLSPLIIKAFYYLLPSLENFNLNDAVSHQTKIPADFVGNLFLYTLIFTLIFLLLSKIIFERKDF